MNHPESFPPPFCLQQWLIQPELNRISDPRSSRGPVQIEPRVMAVLLALAARPGELVTRLDLLDQVWGDTVVGEEILTRAVSELRRVFGDNARRPAYIETIRNNGYRLIVAVVPAEVEAAPVLVPAPAPATAPTASPASLKPPVPERRGGSWLRLSIVALVLVGLAVLGPRLLRHDPPATGADARPPVVIPLTTFPGREYHPALSADGTRVAFAWSGLGGERTAIHIKQRNSETPLQLSDEPGWAAWPTWSPDGQTVAFVQTSEAISAICLVPSLGGAVRRIYTVAHLIEGLDWSPDGSRLAFSARDTVSGQYRLLLLDLATLAVAPVPTARPDNAGDFQPRFSPDGARLAWIGHDRRGGNGLFVVPVAGGDPRAVQFGLENLQGLAWTATGRDLVYAAAPAGVYQLWQAPAKGGAAQLIRTPGEYAWNPTIARSSGDLVYEQMRVDQDLWRVQIADRKTWQIETTPLITSTRWEFEADFHPDGRTVAFVSARSGNPEIWRADTEGRNLQKLTALGASAVSNVRWSPGGDRLACNAVVGGVPRILVVDPAGGEPLPVTTGRAREVFVSWSVTGDGLLIGADGGEGGQGWQVYRLGLTGDDPIQVTRDGGLAAQESADGRTLYFTRPGRRGLWRRQAGGRVESELVLPDLLPRDRFNWRLRGDRIIWVMRAGGAALLAEYDIASGHSLLLAELPGLQGAGLAVAPSGDTFLYPKMGEAAGDLMLIAGWGMSK